MSSPLPLASHGVGNWLECWSHGPSVLLPSGGVHTCFERQVAANPGAVALVAGQKIWSYDRLNRQSNRLAHLLLARTLPAESVVALRLDRCLDMVVALLAILKAGAAYLPLDPLWPQDRQTSLLKDSGCSLLITKQAFLLETDEDVPTVPLDDPDCLALLDLQPETNPGGRHQPSDLAYILYTSGSTGKPKGVLIEHRSILRLVMSPGPISIQPEDHVLQHSPLGFDAATFEIWGALLNGSRLVLAPGPTATLVEIARSVEGNGITVLWLTSALFEAMVEEHLPALAGVRTILSGGDVLSPPHVQRMLEAMAPGQTLINGYGPTENTTFTCCHAMAGGTRVDPLGVPIGKPIANTSVYVVDGAGGLCPVGVPGELWIGGAGVARGYLNREELTAERFVADVYGGEAGGTLYRSGDVVSWREDGTLAFHGRVDEQIKLRGFRIEPGEVEAALNGLAGIGRSLVVCGESGSGQKQLVGYWVSETGLEGDVAWSSAELRRALGERLPGYMVPPVYVRLGSFPLTANGKIDRRALPAPAVAEGEREEGAGTELEEELRVLWEEVLGVEGVGRHENFFEVGGHSLAAARLAGRIEQQLGVSLPIAAFFQAQTVAELAVLLESRRAERAGDGVAIRRAEPLWVGEGEEWYRASSAQSRLWFVEQLDPGGSAYHLVSAWELAGEVDVGALQRALDRIVERHGVLRTSFRLEEGELLQVVHGAQGVELGVMGVPAGEGEVWIGERIEEEIHRPFDLTKGPLLRGLVIRRGEGEWVLVLTVHHIASDGWSRSVFERELTELYGAERRGEVGAVLPALGVQYADYAEWQREWLRGERGEELVGYWREELAGLELLELPSDQARPAEFSHRGGSVRFELGEEETAGLQGLCQAEGASLQMGLLTLVAVLLHRYSGQGDVAIGVPTWGRSHPELEGLIGFFINTLVIRTRMGEGSSFRELLREVRERSLSAYEHQELPFEQVVEALGVERDRSRNPLVQVFLQLLELPEGALELEGAEGRSLDVALNRCLVDLNFHFHRNGAALQGQLFYCTDLFAEDRITRMVDHLRTLADSVLANPDGPVSTMEILPSSEKRQLATWSRGPFQANSDLCVHQLVEQQAGQAPEAIAVVAGEARLSYGELNRRANRLAHQLVAQGVTSETIVGLHLQRSVEMMVALLATLKAGGAYLPLDPTLPAHRIRTIVDDASPTLVLSTRDLSRQLAVASTAILCIEDGADGSDPDAAGSSHPAPARATLSSLAYVLYTSGSTGRPKGVCVDHAALSNRCSAYARIWKLRPGDAVLFHSALGFDMACREWLLPLTVGATVVLVDDGDRREPARLLATMRRHRCTHATATPSLWTALLDHGFQPDGAMSLIAGGEPLTAPIAEQLLSAGPVSLIHSYGPTETCLASTYFPVTSPVPPRPPIGTPLPSTEVHVLDGHLQPCPIGVTGELHVGGEDLARGYLKQPDLTAERFFPNPFSPDPKGRLYKTGDLASWNSDGTLVLHGRADDQIKLRGYRIEPGEIASALCQLPGIQQACVILREDQPGHPMLVAYWMAADPEVVAGQEPDGYGPEQLREHLATTLPDYMIPQAFLPLSRFPLTANGKLDRRRLPKPEVVPSRGIPTAPQTPLEHHLLGLWQEVLGRSDFGTRDNFFQLGGHSLAAARLMARLAQGLGMALPMSIIFQAPTIADLAARIGDDSGASGAFKRDADQLMDVFEL